MMDATKSLKNIVVYCGSHAGSNPAVAKAAEELGTWIARSGHCLVYGAGHKGVMGILADAALAAGGQVIGVIPDFMEEREWGHHGLTKKIVTKTMFDRKQIMLEKGDVYLALPGGGGTMEEITEAISQVSLKLQSGPCLFVNTDGYYEPIKEMYDSMVRQGFMSQENRDNIYFPATVEEVVKILEGYGNRCVDN